MAASTYELAKKLGIIEIVKTTSKLENKYNTQTFKYLLVIDFESTCWDKNWPSKATAEIIEFPAVLYDVSQRKIVSEFQQYVMPLDNPKLSEFCKNLTGITQTQVDNGVPIGTCLMIFAKWITGITKKFKLNMGNDCGIVTWSDWDLKICLDSECKRKRLDKPEYFNKWIDIRALYREYYKRKPNGLNGALTELGLQFEGRQHCGLHDARNTAYLAGRMISDGILFRITKELLCIFQTT